MKWIVLTALMLMMASGALAATIPGSIGLFNDLYAADCNVYDQGPGFVYVHVFHVHAVEVSGSQFMVSQAYGAALTYLGELVSFPTSLGNANIGVAVAYGSCLYSPIHILRITYYGSGLSEPCSMLRVVPDPNHPSNVAVTDCAYLPNILAANGGEAYVNPNANCQCDVQVEETSWGRIKSLYR